MIVDKLNGIEFAKYLEFDSKHHSHLGITKLTQRYPSGFGVISTVECSVCGEIQDITDCDCW